MNFCPKLKLQGFEKKTIFMFKYFQVSIQKVKKNLNLNWNMAIMHNHTEFKFNFQTKYQKKFSLKQKLKISKF